VWTRELGWKQSYNYNRATITTELQLHQERGWDSRFM